MRLNTANRSFFALVATALVPYGLLGLFGCGLLSVVGYRLAADGLSGLERPGQDLRPAVVFFAVVATGTVIAGLSVRRQLAATRALASAVAERTLPLPPELARAADRARIGGRLDLVDDRQPFSFTHGLVWSRVAVSRGLVDAASATELEAVLHHEAYHVRNWDTVKVVVARAAPSAFFFLPALGHLRDRYLAGRELAADRRAVRAAGDGALAGALCKVVDGPAGLDLGAAAALGGSGFLEQRVAQLEGGHEPPLPRLPRLPRPALWLTVTGLVGLVSAFVLTVARAGTDMLSMDRSMPSSVAGSALTVLGSAVCMAAVVLVAVAVTRRGARHRPAG